jgi:UDP-N-acetylmuramoyl-tripeptide--D-alanyl-D-alanine ligase
MDTFWTIVFMTLWGGSFLRYTLTTLYYLQLKEYRFDRMRDFLGTKKGKRLLYHPNTWCKGILLLATPILFLLEGGEVLLPVLLLLYYAYQGLLGAHGYKTHTLYRPVFTAKVGVVVVLTLLIEGILLIHHFSLAMLLALEIGRGLIILLVLGILYPPTLLAKQWYFFRARQLLKKLPHLTVIGITGSYGKTTTKDMLTTILQSKYKTIATPKHINTDIGVAKVIPRLLKEMPDAEYFVVEMGAYKRGEIASLCRIVRPKMAILTGVNEQHLNLFGGLSNTYQAKFELPLAVPVEEGVVVLNGDQHYPSTVLKKLYAKRLVYSKVSEYGDAYAQNIREEQGMVRFTVHREKEKEEITLALGGHHNVGNFLGCVLIAHEAGMSLKEIKEAAKGITPQPQSLVVKPGIRGALIIDDSYNANKDGFFSAIETLGKVEGKRKWIITMGILELGKETQSIHRGLGETMGKVADRIILLNEDIEGAIRSTVPSTCEVHLIENLHKMHEYVLREVQEGDVILLENRVPESLRRDLFAHE